MIKKFQIELIPWMFLGFLVEDADMVTIYLLMRLKLMLSEYCNLCKR